MNQRGNIPGLCWWPALKDMCEVRVDKGQLARRHEKCEKLISTTKVKNTAIV
jgi:hypothetical protein